MFALRLGLVLRLAMGMGMGSEWDGMGTGMGLGFWPSCGEAPSSPVLLLLLHSLLHPTLHYSCCLAIREFQFPGL